MLYLQNFTDINFRNLINGHLIKGDFLIKGGCLIEVCPYVIVHLYGLFCFFCFFGYSNDVKTSDKRLSVDVRRKSSTVQYNT